MRFALYAVVAAGIASSVYAEASAEDNLVERGISFGTIKIPLPVLPKAPAPAPKPAPKPAPAPIIRPGTIALPLPIHFKRDELEERAIIKPGTIFIPLPVGKPGGAPAPAPKPAPAPIKPPGTLKIWLRSVVARGFSIGSLKIPLPIGKAPAPAPKPAPKPAPAPIIRPGTIALPLPIHFKRALASCTEKQIACPVPGLLHGFDCVDIATDVQQCGDCQALGGVDCTRIPGAGGVSCRNGYCHVESCVEGWAYDFRKRSCVQAPKFWTQ